MASDISVHTHIHTHTRARALVKGLNPVAAATRIAAVVNFRSDFSTLFMANAAERGVKGSRGTRECFFFNGGERRRNHPIASLMAFHPTDGEIRFSPHFLFLSLLVF